MDIKSKEERSRNMAKIRAKDTKPELFIRSTLHALNFRYRVNYKDVTGHPDLYFTKRKVAVFIHGCYWHRHKNCKFSYTPKSSLEFWHGKFQANQERDKIVLDDLLGNGIRVLIIWECSVKKMINDPTICNLTVNKISNFIRTADKCFMEI